MITLRSALQRALSVKGIGLGFLGLALSISINPQASQAEEFYGSWLQLYQNDSPISQGGTATAMDSRGNVAVVGYNFSGNRKVYYTAKYEGATGLLLWQRTYDAGFGENEANAVAFDSAGNVIVTGTSVGNGTNRDYLTIKYHGETGNDFWAQPIRFNGPSGGADEALKLAVDASDNIIVTGRSTGVGTNYDICTIKYTPAGAEFWASPRRYNSASNRDDRPFAIVVDGTSNTIIVGEADIGSDTKMVTLKYAAANGALSWGEAKLYQGGGNPSFYGGTDVAVDSAGNVYAAGIVRSLAGISSYHLIRYEADGDVDWQRTGSTEIDSPASSPVYVGADVEGNAILSCTSYNDDGDATIETVKYDVENGSVLWRSRSPAPGGDDAVRGQIVDGSSNTILIGESSGETSSLDYYVAKYSRGGDLLYETRFNGDFGGNGGSDIPRGLAIDPNGNVAVTGEATMDFNGSGRTRLVTFKLNRFLAFTGDEVPDSPIEDAVYSSLGVPAVGDTGAIAARVVLADGKKKVAAILAQGAGGNNSLPAVHNADAPGIDGATFKSFLDPVIAPNGRYAFIAKLGGVKGSESSTVWTNAITGNLQLALRQGAELTATGLEAGTRVKSISGISLRNGTLVALIRIAGEGINKKNDTVLLRRSILGNAALLRTGQAITVGDEPETEISGISVLSPAKGSPGYGRWHVDGRVVARLTLADKRVVVVAVTTGGVITPLLYSGGDASGAANGGVWKTLNFPAAGGNNGHYAALGTLERGGDVTAGSDTALVYSATGSAFSAFAVEGDVAPQADGATYGGFLDPLVNNNGEVAFVAALKGKGVKGANSALYWGMPGAPNMVARTGDLAPDIYGDADTAEFSSFLSVALPSGTGAGPIFVAKLRGKGVNGKNNLGIWAVHSNGTELRQILRTGSRLGVHTVARIALLQSLPGSAGAARSYNSNGTVSALVTFTGGSQALINLGIP